MGTRIQIKDGGTPMHDEHLCGHCERCMVTVQGNDTKYYCHELSVPITKPVVRCTGYVNRAEPSARMRFKNQFLTIDYCHNTGDMQVRDQRAELIPRKRWTTVPASEGAEPEEDELRRGGGGRVRARRNP